MSKLCKVMYLLNEEGRKASLLGGGDGNRVQSINTPITKELLDLASVDDEGEAIVKIGYRGSGDDWYESSKIKISTKILDDKYRRYNLEKPEIKDVTKIVEFDKPQTIEELLAFERNRVLTYEKSLNENKEKIKSILVEFEEEKKIREKEIKEQEERRRIEKEELKERRRIEKEKEEEKIRQEKLRKEAEKEDDTNWIKTKGSDYLKQCLKLGYNCQRKYMEERVEKEFPGFELDFDDYAGWKVRVSPSQEALDEVTKWLDKGFKSQIVWLTASVNGSEYDYENGFEECEAIAIKFKNYWLVKEM